MCETLEEEGTAYNMWQDSCICHVQCVLWLIVFLCCARVLRAYAGMMKFLLVFNFWSLFDRTIWFHSVTDSGTGKRKKEKKTITTEKKTCQAWRMKCWKNRSQMREAISQVIKRGGSPSGKSSTGRSGHVRPWKGETQNQGSKTRNPFMRLHP